jgi:hypothetical protein
MEEPVDGNPDDVTWLLLSAGVVVVVVVAVTETFATTVEVLATVVVGASDEVLDELLEAIVGTVERPKTSSFNTKTSVPPAEVRFVIPASVSKSVVS